MRIFRFLDGRGNVCWGQDYDGKYASLLRREPIDAAEDFGNRIQVEKILPPIDPRVVMCIGLNYRAHAEETGAPIPEKPVLFMKNPASVIPTNTPIELPKDTVVNPEVDFECELAVVIGKAAKNVTEAEARECVMGYTVANDISARVWQKKRSGGQFVRGKSFDTFCPLGPCLVTPTALPDPQELRLKTRLNGELMQDGTTADMIFPVFQLISELSYEMTLLPGTVILTGTPSGVGVARDPQVFLKPGDEIEVEIEGIGKLRNSVIQA